MINDVFVDMDGVLVDFVGSALWLYKQGRDKGDGDIYPEPFSIDGFLRRLGPPGEWKHSQAARPRRRRILGDDRRGNLVGGRGLVSITLGRASLSTHAKG